jgi:hypothetical protein
VPRSFPSDNQHRPLDFTPLAPFCAAGRFRPDRHLLQLPAKDIQVGETPLLGLWDCVTHGGFLGLSGRFMGAKTLSASRLNGLGPGAFAGTFFPFYPGYRPSVSRRFDFETDQFSLPELNLDKIGRHPSRC